MNARSRTYWACQIFGWGAYSAVGWWSAYLSSGWRPGVAVGYVFFFVYSIALTHLERRIMQRRGWLHLSTGKALPRFLAAILITGGIQALLVVVIAAALGNPFGRTGALAAWSGLTVANGCG